MDPEIRQLREHPWFRVERMAEYLKLSRAEKDDSVELHRTFQNATLFY